MPYLTRDVDTNGALMVRAVVGVSRPRATMLVGRNLEVPKDVVVDAVVDTGASCSCVDRSVLRQLHLVPTGVTLIHTPSTGAGPAMASQFDISLKIVTKEPSDALHRPLLPVIGCDFSSQGFQMLIGRDILSGCLLVWDGLRRCFSFAY